MIRQEEYAKFLEDPIAEVSAAILGLWLAYRELKQRGARASLMHTFDRREVRRAFVVNSDIMIRTFCVLTVTGVFVASGAGAGDVALAANHVLQNLLHICIYFLDGFAYAVEALVGQAIGARLYARFSRAVWLCTLWAGGFSVLLAAAYWFAGPHAIDFMTTNASVRAMARTYLVWAALGPILGVWCFLLDGIFIGATRTGDMRNMMLISLAVYLAACTILTNAYGNHGLWASLMVFYIARTSTLLWRYPALVRASFANCPKHSGTAA
jgi:MATE family multidrug resistance protein